MGLLDSIQTYGRVHGKYISSGSISEDRLDTDTRAKLGSSTMTVVPYTANTVAALTDAGANKLVTMTVAGANTYTVPPNNTVAFPVGSTINIASMGAGQTSIVAGAGVTINPATTLKLRVQYSSATLIQMSANVWLLAGDISA